MAPTDIYFTNGHHEIGVVVRSVFQGRHPSGSNPFVYFSTQLSLILWMSNGNPPVDAEKLSTFSKEKHPKRILGGQQTGHFYKRMILLIFSFCRECINSQFSHTCKQNCRLSGHSNLSSITLLTLARLHYFTVR